MGGNEYKGTYSGSAELFNEATDRFEPYPGERQLIPRDGAAAFTFPNGSTYIAGGWNGGPIASVEQFYPSTGSFVTAPWLLLFPRWAAAYAPVSGNGELVAGGEGPAAEEALDTAELVKEPPARATVSGGYFGSEAVGESSAVQNVVVSSSGETPLVVSAVKLSGPGASQFHIYQESCSGSELIPGSLCTVSIYFAPTAVGEAKATLSLEGNATPPASAALVGIGVPVGAGPSGERGPTGPTGPVGPTGPAGREQRVNVRHCVTVKKRVRRHGRVVVKHVRRCTAVHRGGHNRRRRRVRVRRHAVVRRRG